MNIDIIVKRMMFYLQYNKGKYSQRDIENFIKEAYESGYSDKEKEIEKLLEETYSKGYIEGKKEIFEHIDIIKNYHVERKDK